MDADPNLRTRIFLPLFWCTNIYWRNSLISWIRKLLERRKESNMQMRASEKGTPIVSASVHGAASRSFAFSRWIESISLRFRRTGASCCQYSQIESNLEPKWILQTTAKAFCYWRQTWLWREEEMSCLEICGAFFGVFLKENFRDNVFKSIHMSMASRAAWLTE